MIKRLLMFLAALYLSLGLSFGAFAHEVYTTSNEDSAYVDCPGYAFYWKDKHKKVSGTGWFTMKNNTSSVQTATYTLTICSPGAPCTSKSAKGNSIPWQVYHSPPIGLFVPLNLFQKGSTTYKVMLDVTGYKTLHTEKKCLLVLK
jgi:hypothetical protein